MPRLAGDEKLRRFKRRFFWVLGVVLLVELAAVIILGVSSGSRSWTVLLLFSLAGLDVLVGGVCASIAAWSEARGR